MYSLICKNIYKKVFLTDKRCCSTIIILWYTNLIDQGIKKDKKSMPPLLSSAICFLFFFWAFFLTKTRCTRLSFFYSLQFQRTLTLDSSFSLKCLSLFNFCRKKNKYYLKSYLPTYFKKFHKNFVVWQYSYHLNCYHPYQESETLMNVGKLYNTI